MNTDTPSAPMRGDQEAGRHAPDCGVDRQAPRLSADDGLKVGHLTSNAKAPLDVSHQQSSARGHGDPAPMHSVKSFDGYHIWLTTGDGNDQRIALEPSVFRRLVNYEDRLRHMFAARPNLESEARP